MQKTILFLPAAIHSHVLSSLFVAGLLREDFVIIYSTHFGMGLVKDYSGFRSPGSNFTPAGVSSLV
ncbi:hypothetical protein [Dyadobacter jejuensis]|nr:hypothetical protein [Dyadobacter jejuensis]